MEAGRNEKGGGRKKKAERVKKRPSRCVEAGLEDCERAVREQRGRGEERKR